MSLFGGLTSTGLEETQDRVGGFAPKESGIYTGKIKAMYAGESSGGAKSVSIIVDIDGSEYKETCYITNKKGENFFLNKQDTKKKVPLPGFTIIDDICLATTGKALAEQDTEEKVVQVYDADAGKALPKAVPMLIDCLGQEISLGIIKQMVNKNVKQGNDYVPTAEVREENFTDKVFHTETKMTIVEARQGAEEAKFWGTWEERNKGVTRDKRTIKDGQGGAQAGAPKAAGAQTAASPSKSLFGKK